MLVFCYQKHPWTFYPVNKFHSTAACFKLAPRKGDFKAQKAVCQLRQNTWHHIKNPDTSNPSPLPNPINTEQFLQPLQIDDETHNRFLLANTVSSWVLTLCLPVSGWEATILMVGSGKPSSPPKLPTNSPCGIIIIYQCIFLLKLANSPLTL